MKNASLETAAKILEVTEESLDEFPDDIKNSMLSVMEMIEPDDEESCKILYSSLKELWEQGSTYADMKEISEKTGADLDTLMSLDQRSQMNIYCEYAIDTAEGNENAVSNVYDNIRIALENKKNMEEFL